MTSPLRSSPRPVASGISSLRYAHTSFDVCCCGGARERHRFSFGATARGAAEAGRDGSVDAGACDRDAWRYGLSAALGRDRSLRRQERGRVGFGAGPHARADGWCTTACLLVAKGTGNIETKRRFKDYQLHVEWRIPENITGSGQARGNSGLFLASRVRATPDTSCRCSTPTTTRRM